MMHWVFVGFCIAAGFMLFGVLFRLLPFLLLIGSAVAAWFLLYDWFENTQHPGLWATLVVSAPLIVWGHWLSWQEEDAKTEREIELPNWQQKVAEEDARDRAAPPTDIDWRKR